MKQYFDFNSFEKSIRKSLFEGINLDDDDSEEVQLEKPAADNSELFKQESEQMQFRKMVNAFIQPIKSNDKCKINGTFFGSYIKDGQKHYTFLIKYSTSTIIVEINDYYLFDYCFETNNFLIFNILLYLSAHCLINQEFMDLISECKYPINIYYGIITGVQFDDLQDLTLKQQIASKVNRIAFAYGARPVPHKFFDKFKGFTSKYKSSKSYMKDIRIDEKNITMAKACFEDPTDYDKFNEMRLQACKK